MMLTMTTPPSLTFRKKLDDTGIRRRLFQSPNSHLGGTGHRGRFSEGRSGLFGVVRHTSGSSVWVVFGLFAIVVLLGVHLYLFEVVVFQSNNVKSKASDIVGDSGLLGGGPPGKGSVHNSVLRGGGFGSEKLSDISSHNNNVTSSSVVWPPPQFTKLTPLRPIDMAEFTIRINTWKRNEQLILSVNHHASCPGVSQVQIVWCDPDEDPPDELLNHPSNKVVIERHVVNSLNARFDIRSTTGPIPPTLGVLSIDDDVLRPCDALDAGFFKWTNSPHRMVGYDGRLHVEKDDGNWAYGYMSTMEKENQYSLSLTRYCFLHRDYLDMYTRDLPRQIYNKVAESFNCEDIAMSFMISSLTDGQPPLLADLWALKSMVKMYTPEGKISGTKQHKSIRDDCVNSFAILLGLKEQPKGPHGGGDVQNSEIHLLKKAKYYHTHDTMFESGAPLDDKAHAEAKSFRKPVRQLELEQIVQKWHGDANALNQDMRYMMSTAAKEAFKHGLVENSEPWKERFDIH